MIRAVTAALIVALAAAGCQSTPTAKTTKAGERSESDAGR